MQDKLLNIIDIDWLLYAIAPYIKSYRAQSMPQHFLLSIQARSLSIRQVFGMTDDQAFDLFKELRWEACEETPMLVGVYNPAPNVWNLPLFKKFALRIYSRLV